MTEYRTGARSRESVPERALPEHAPRVLLPDGGEADRQPLRTPPRTCTDDEGREIEIRVADGEAAALIEMYLEFEPPDRSQGTPPRHEPQIESWVSALLAGENLNLVAWHNDLAVGHAVLVPREKPQWELAIFIRPPYQGAHIGTELVRTILGLAESEGIERVWLSVERWNTPAVSLYEKIGFETTNNANFEMEMALRLAPAE